MVSNVTGTAKLSTMTPCVAQECAQLWAARQKAEDAERTGAGYGLQLAHLALCDRHCGAALKQAERKHARRIDADALKIVQALRAHVQATREEVEADNLSIYREKVPLEAELEKQLPVSLAKATPPDAVLIGLQQGRTRVIVESLKTKWRR